MGRDRAGGASRPPAARAAAVAVPVPAAHAAGAAARLPRDRRRRTRGLPTPPRSPRPPFDLWAGRAERARAPHRRRPRAACADGKPRSGWPAATTSSSPTATARSTPRAARASTPTSAEQLQSRLERGTGVRRRIGVPTSSTGCSGKVARTAELIDRLHWDNWFEGRRGGHPPATATAGLRPRDRQRDTGRLARRTHAPQARAGAGPARPRRC